MRDSGTKPLIKNMAKAIRFGLMEASTKVTGRMAKRSVKEDSFMLTETYTMATGWTTRLMEQAVIFTQMELSIMDSGS